MNRAPLLVTAMTVALFLPGCGGYSDLREQWEKYEPSPFYRTTLSPATLPAARPERPEDDFKAQQVHLEQMRKTWEETLESPEGKTGGSYVPDPVLLKALLPARELVSVAREVLAGRFSLAEVETLAVLRNPGVRSAEFILRASLEDYGQAANLDEILRQYSAFTNAAMPGVGPMKGGEPVEMKFPFPGVLSLKGEIVTETVKISNQNLETARRTALTQVRKAFWNLLFIQRAQNISEGMLDLLEKLEEVAATRYETGKASFQDLIKIRIERDKLGEELNTLKAQQGNIEMEILNVLDVDPLRKMGSPISQKPVREVPDVESLYPVALENRQELKKLRFTLARTEKTLEMAETAIYPPYSLNLSLFQNEAVTKVGTARQGEPFSVEPQASAGAGLPKMPWYGANDAYLREIRQRLKALRQDLKRAENETRVRVREVWFRLDRARREEALYAQRVIHLSWTALEVSRRGYETGTVPFADVIASYTNWLLTNLSLERRRGDLGIAQADLAEALGIPGKSGEKGSQ
jgi:outer membrane protein, heavy metal efflux system